MAKFNATQLEDFVRDRAPQIAKDIRAAADKAHNEADLVAEVEKLLDRFDQNPDFDIQLHLERERSLLNGRADAVYNRFVIEYEPPHSLQKTNSARTNRHAIDQVKQYMDGLERLDRHKKERLAGVVLDGSFYIFIRHRDERWFEDDPLPVDAHSTQTFLRYLLSLSTELALTPQNLVRDFGANSNTARQVVPTIYKAIKETQNPKAKILFQQWQRQFQEVSGYDPSSGQLDTIEIGREYAIKDKNPDLDQLFFAIHTYYATFIKLLALQVAYFYLMPKMGSGLASSADYSSDKLCSFLQEMERGGLFAQLGIRNFLEGDFFGWYLDTWDENLDIALRRLIGDLANYSLVTLDIDPEETRDLLKQLYQNLMPKKLRHALGEYYTPDWLADRLLNQLGYEGDPRTRLLDPAVGSGTFLVLAIKRIRKYADEKMLPPAGVLEQILENIVGYDLNPLAVISARTNYLLALGDLLESRRGDITIPIYLCDSILTPSQGNDLFTQGGYGFKTAVGYFSVPRSLVKAHYIDQFADLLEECIHNNSTEEIFRIRFKKAFPLNVINDKNEIDIACDLYRKLGDLEKNQINGIWARIIKNAFAPLFQGKFDYIAGNPPWINWANLPSEYRQELSPFWQKYGLFPHTGLQARLGSAMDDISILMTYVALDNYLKENGKLGFVITQTVFKSEGGGAGFRRFKLNATDYIKIIFVDDFSEIQIFEGATNRTSVVVIQKNKATVYPVMYNFWKKKVKGESIHQDYSLAEAIKMMTVLQWEARPVSPENLTSPWFTGRSKAISGISKCIGNSYYQARMGVHCHGNGYFWVNIIAQRPDGSFVVSNIPEAGRNQVESIQTAVDEHFLYPLLRGKDVKQWSSLSQVYIILPYDKDNASKAIPIREMNVNFPATYNYFENFKDELSKRSGYIQFFNPRIDPYYSMYNVGEYTFSPYKVVWRYIASEFTCAVIDTASILNLTSKVVIPETKLVLVGLDNEQEAHYLCACLSTSINKFLVKSYAVNIQIATHVLNYINVPKFEENNQIHLRLADLSKEAHEIVAKADTECLNRIENEIDYTASKLWGIDQNELIEIQQCLKRLNRTRLLKGRMIYFEK